MYGCGFAQRLHCKVPKRGVKLDGRTRYGTEIEPKAMDSWTLKDVLLFTKDLVRCASV